MQILQNTRGRKVGSSTFANVKIKQLLSIISEDSIIPVQKKWLRDLLGVRTEVSMSKALVRIPQIREKVRRGAEKVIADSLSGIQLEAGLIEAVALTCRHNVKIASRRAEEIREWCIGAKSNTFFHEDWAQLCRMWKINPYGATDLEIQLLAILRDSGATTLTEASNQLKISKFTVKNELEPHLLRHKLIEIRGLRGITQIGLEVLREIEKRDLQLA